MAAQSASTYITTRVRYRCEPCEVAWTSSDDPACWVCGDDGSTLRTAKSLREDEHLHLDFN